MPSRACGPRRTSDDDLLELNRRKESGSKAVLDADWDLLQGMYELPPSLMDRDDVCVAGEA